MKIFSLILLLIGVIILSIKHIKGSFEPIDGVLWVTVIANIILIIII